MKRVGLYLGFPPEGGGAFQYAQSILAGLAAMPRERFEIVAAYTNTAWATNLAAYADRIRAIPVSEGPLEAIVRAGLRFGLPLGPWRRAARRIHPLTRKLLDQGCDLWLFPAQDIWTYAIPVPALGVVHDLMHRYERGFPEVSRFGLYGRRERHYRRLCACARGILVDSTVGKQQVIDAYGLAAEQIHILPYVAPGYVQASGVEDRGLSFELPERFIFYPAQFWAHKNHLRLLEAMAAVSAAEPHLHLVLAGSQKNAYEEVMQRVARLGLTDRVHVLGYVPDADMAVLYKRALALVMPTFFGPTNIPPLEAMAAGCPMAISNVYAMPEQVGDAALLFDPRSTEEMADAIRRLAADSALRARLVAAGRARVAQWGVPQFNQRLAQIVETVTAR